MMGGGVHKESILGFAVCTDPLDRLRDEVFKVFDTDQGGRKWLACLNPHSIVEARRRREFASALRAADWLVPDGIGVVLASLIRGGKLRRRVTGSDVFRMVMDEANRRGGLSVFFLGSTDGVLERISRRVRDDYPAIRLAGVYSPPFTERFTEEEVKKIIREIDEARPDILWVGLTAPKQELWLAKHLRLLTSVRFAGAVGAVFDFYAGTVKRPHPVFQRAGLEWLPRLLRQPSRLWRRMFISAPIFLWIALTDVPAAGRDAQTED
jgi:N-acetylglucosaminyldiphosphoundecaprenol N-acetyl-beta-D-mannosaminyltransferase